MSANACAAADRQTRALSLTRIDGNSCNRTPITQGTGTNRMEIADQFGRLYQARLIQKLDWYALRWKIEVFHKILKSGCKVEESQLQIAERLVSLIATCCILSWRIFWITMINRRIPISPQGSLSPSWKWTCSINWSKPDPGRPQTKRTWLTI